jgi:hypothetical protein
MPRRGATWSTSFSDPARWGARLATTYSFTGSGKPRACSTLATSYTSHAPMLWPSSANGSWPSSGVSAATTSFTSTAMDVCLGSIMRELRPGSSSGITWKQRPSARVRVSASHSWGHMRRRLTSTSAGSCLDQPWNTHAPQPACIVASGRCQGFSARRTQACGVTLTVTVGGSVVPGARRTVGA